MAGFGIYFISRELLSSSKSVFQATDLSIVYEICILSRRASLSWTRANWEYKLLWEKKYSTLVRGHCVAAARPWKKGMNTKKTSIVFYLFLLCLRVSRRSHRKLRLKKLFFESKNLVYEFDCFWANRRYWIIWIKYHYQYQCNYFMTLSNLP